MKTGEININEGFSLEDVVSQFKKQPDAKEFVVTINSPGGNAEEGREILNYLKNHKIKVVTVVPAVPAKNISLVALAILKFKK